jgi:hypothetical protein
MALQNNNTLYTLMRINVIILLCFSCSKLYAQENFADKCIGKWEGIMYMYGKGQLRDSLPVELDVQKTNRSDTWLWKTTYLSKTMPAVKDYKLVLKDAVTQTYATDEGNGIELMDYYFKNKLYSIFETHGVMLTSSYELQGNQLIFEVTSGKKIDENKEVNNYSVLNLQRVIFKRRK